MDNKLDNKEGQQFSTNGFRVNLAKSENDDRKELYNTGFNDNPLPNNIFENRGLGNNGFTNQNLAANEFSDQGFNNTFQNSDFTNNSYTNNNFGNSGFENNNNTGNNTVTYNNGFGTNNTYSEQPKTYQQFGFNAQGQQNYNNMVQQPFADNTNMEEVVSFSEWMISFLVMSIPCLGIAMMFAWAFGSNINKSKSNFFKALLVWSAIWTVVAVIFLIIIMVMASSFV